MTTCPSSKRVGFAKVDLQTGAVSLLFEEDKRYGGYGTEPTVSPDGARVVYVAEDALEPADLFVLGGDLSRPRKVSQVAPALTGRVLGKAETIEWRSVDGETMRGALVYPAGYDHGKTYPLIVKVYGGSSISNDLNRFGYALAAVENLQLYATRGYAVLLADSKLSLGTPMADLMKSDDARRRQGRRAGRCRPGAPRNHWPQLRRLQHARADRADVALQGRGVPQSRASPGAAAAAARNRGGVAA